MSDLRGVDSDPGWINRKFRELERMIEGLRSERRAASTTISDGGLTINGGDVVMLDTDGSVLFRLGQQPQGDRGISISRDDGSVAFEIRKPFSPTDTSLMRLFDAGGHALLAEEILGDGLNSPYLSMPVQPVGVTPTAGPFGWERATTSATFEDLFRWQGARQNQWYRPILNVRCSLADTAAEVRIVNAAGTVLTPFLAGAWVGVAAAGVTTDREISPPGGLGLTSTFGADQVIRVQARRTAGTGTVTVAVKKSEGGNA